MESKIHKTVRTLTLIDKAGETNLSELDIK